MYGRYAITEDKNLEVRTLIQPLYIVASHSRMARTVPEVDLTSWVECNIASLLYIVAKYYYDIVHASIATPLESAGIQLLAWTLQNLN